MGAVATDPTAAVPELDERQSAVLLAVVRAYVRVGEPVGSRSVVDEAGRFQGVVEMAHLNKAIRRAQYEARAHYEELERA